MDKIYKHVEIETPLGSMIGIADKEALYLLEFQDHPKIEKRISAFPSESGRTPILDQIEQEIADYFDGKLIRFTTPLELVGSDFQLEVWNALKKIPYGQTLSYSGLAKAIGKSSAERAVGSANGTNRCPLIIPCHRVICSDGSLGGYSSGTKRKEWLLAHEKRVLGYG